jgi:hypothetical protein
LAVTLFSPAKADAISIRFLTGKPLPVSQGIMGFFHTKHLECYPPQMSTPGTKIIYAVFVDAVISYGFGKKSVSLFTSRKGRIKVGLPETGEDWAEAGRLGLWFCSAKNAFPSGRT